MRAIEAATFSHCYALEKVIITNNITFIGTRPFSWCTTYTPFAIYYTGTEEQWKTISVDPNDEEIFSSPIYYYSENIPADNVNNYWHYDENGIPTKW